MRRVFATLTLAFAACAPGAAALADQVAITPGDMRRVIEFGAHGVVIAREQDPGATIPPDYARTARACPPWCITPAEAAPGIATIAELELLAFMETALPPGEGVLIDARLPEQFQRGAIPGAVNVPFAALDPANPYRAVILEALGARQAGTGWDFASARRLAVYCGGPWSDQAQRAIRALLEAGYPAERLLYYRGGMQDWVMLGLTTFAPAPMN